MSGEQAVPEAALRAVRVFIDAAAFAELHDGAPARVVAGPLPEVAPARVAGHGEADPRRVHAGGEIGGRARPDQAGRPFERLEHEGELEGVAGAEGAVEDRAAP